MPDLFSRDVLIKLLFSLLAFVVLAGLGFAGTVFTYYNSASEKLKEISVKLEAMGNEVSKIENDVEKNLGKVELVSESVAVLKESSDIMKKQLKLAQKPAVKVDDGGYIEVRDTVEKIVSYEIVLVFEDGRWGLSKTPYSSDYARLWMDSPGTWILDYQSTDGGGTQAAGRLGYELEIVGPKKDMTAEVILGENSKYVAAHIERQANGAWHLHVSRYAEE